MLPFFVLTIIFQTILLVENKKGYGPGEQDWGFAEVRKGAHMFYWLYYADTKADNYTERPLAIWIAGGPGVSASYFSNFHFLGPLDNELKERNNTWTQYVNVLFIDSPVGTGFSYVRNGFKLAKTNTRMALDLVELMKTFYKNHAEFIGVPVHIFGESYGCKVAAEFALEFYRAHERNEISNTVESVSFLSSWMSPKDLLSETPAAAYYLGVIGKNEFETLTRKVNRIVDFDDTKKCPLSLLYLIGEHQLFLCAYVRGAYLFNVNYLVYEDKKEFVCGTTIPFSKDAELFMNEFVRKDLDLGEHKWSQPFTVGLHLRQDICHSALHIVDQLLNSTTVHVNVLSGSMDLIAPTVGTLKWIDKLAWESKKDYDDAQRKAIFVNGILEGYEKVGKDLSVYWINRAGHWIPRDNMPALIHVLKSVTKV